MQSDDYNEFEMKRMKEEIADLQNRVLQEISKEQEEYVSIKLLRQLKDTCMKHICISIVLMCTLGKTKNVIFMLLNVNMAFFW